jgi:hypothetical protein
MHSDKKEESRRLSNLELLLCQLFESHMCCSSVHEKFNVLIFLHVLSSCFRLANIVALHVPFISPSQSDFWPLLLAAFELEENQLSAASLHESQVLFSHHLSKSSLT